MFTRKRFTLLGAIIVLFFGISVAIGAGLPHTPGNTIIQNLNGLAPVAGQSGCITQAITKGAVQGRYSSMDGYSGYSGEVVTAAGVAEPAKWKLDGTQVSVGSKFEFTNSGGNTYKRATQEVYSGASRTLTSCTRRQ